LALARIADWLIGSSFLMIFSELLYLRRKRIEFKWCPVLIAFTVLLAGLALFFLLTAGFGLSGRPSIEHMRVFLLSAFAITAAIWLFDTVIRIRDLPRLSELEKQVQERTATLQTVIDASPIAIIRVHFDGTVAMWNPAAERLFGWQADEVLGKPLPIIPDGKQQEFQGLLADTLYNKQHPGLITQRRHRDGHLIDVCIWNAPLRTGKRREETAMVMLADMTQEKQLTENLAQAKAQAERANSAKSKFLAHMSHEIRTPLTSILGFGDLLNSEKSDEEQRRKYVNAIVRNGHALATLIDDLLDLSKVEAGEMKIDPQPVAVRELFEDVKSTLELRATNKDLNFNITISDRVPGEVLTDPLRLRQVLINIAGNAVKFTTEGGVSIHADHREGKLFILVKDTGPGIAESQKERLFKPFSQASDSVAQKFGGTGLGLSLSRELVHLMEGELNLKSSTVGVGSEFEIVVSAPIIHPANESISRINLHPSSRVLTGCKILVADDAEDNLALVSHYLWDAGAEVVTAHDGRDAIEKATSDTFDAILMDIQMPEMDGIEALKELKNRQYRPEVIALTAYALPEERERCMAAGFAGYVTKPIQPQRLISTLAHHVRIKKDIQPVPLHI